MLFTNKNANIGRRKEKQCLEKTKRECKNPKKTEATVIVNIVIVIGSNNHILISCVYGFWSTLTLCALQNKTARMFSSKVGMFTLINVSVCVCECTISKEKYGILIAAGRKQQYRFRTVDVAPFTNGANVCKCVYWWQNCSRSVCVCVFMCARVFPKTTFVS